MASISGSAAFSPSRVTDTNRVPIPLTDYLSNTAFHDSRHHEVSNLDPLAKTRRMPTGPNASPQLYRDERQRTMGEKFNSRRGPRSHLSAATLTADLPYADPFFSLDYPTTLSASGVLDGMNPTQLTTPGTLEGMKSVLSAALLITGNTVGPGMICLPEFASGPGMGVSAALFVGLFGVNLLSGLLIAELAINQYESSKGDVPSSFKDFADSTLQNPLAGNIIASVSVLINWCVLAFSLIRGGDLASTHIGIDHTVATVGVAVAFSCLVGSQKNDTLSKFASAAVGVLFVSFAGMLLPGLANVFDPIGTLLAPGVASDDILGSAMLAAPLFIQSMVYQNIVPSVTKLLDYDRSKSGIAIFLGSFIPTLMYMSFCFASLGGGLDASTTAGSFLATFSLASVAGSCVACIMSIAEEFDSILGKLFSTTSSGQAPDEMSQSVSLPSVILSVAPPLLAGLLFSGGENFSAALTSSGQLCPVLYGILPVVLATVQLRGQDTKTEVNFAHETSKKQQNLLPGGMASLSLLGLSSLGFVGQELWADMGIFIAV